MAKEDVTVNADELQKFLSNLPQKQKEILPNIIEELSNYALNEIKNNYSKAEKEEGETMEFTKTETEYGVTVAMTGPSAPYSEFGTGTMGERNPHPIKNKFDLNPYNSGKMIREANASISKKTGIPEGEKYWTYKNANGEVQHTQGIEPQLEVYNAGIKTINQIPKVVKNKMKEMF